MGYLTKAWQHRLYSFNWPIQIRWQALKPSPKAKLNLTHWWLIYKHILKSYIIFWYSFCTRYICVHKISWQGACQYTHMCTHTHTHTHTCKETHTLSPHRHTRSPINTFKHTLVNIMHMYPFTLQERLSSHHFLCFPFFLFINKANSSI